MPGTLPERLHKLRGYLIYLELFKEITMVRIQNHGRIKTLAFAAIAACLFVAWTFILPYQNWAIAANEDKAAAQKAFNAASEVLFHPRCMNCHPSGDAPMIRDDSQPHMFNVMRGSQGKGVGGLKCTLCHRDANQPEEPPGLANWHMPPENMPMVFQGRTPGGAVSSVERPETKRGQNGGTGDRSYRQGLPGSVGLKPRHGADGPEDESQ